ncbi:MAG TPA: N-acetyl-gamma-glutamyl-phosphate reductase [Acidimicrobiales bacterium]
MTSVGIIGASGFTGAELLRLCAQHPDLDVRVATGDTQAGTRVAELYPHLAAAYGDQPFEPYAPEAVDGLDLVFLGLPHGASQAVVPEVRGRVGRIVDLGADFRLRDAALYPAWYGEEHTAPDLLDGFVYGLPELFRDEIRTADAVAAPGCYVTAATLALAPLLRAGLAAPTGIVVDAACGVSGAGRGLTAATAFCTVDEDFTAYGLLTHRHTPEIEQNLARVAGTPVEVLFTPHLAPMNRGILATCYARPAAADAGGPGGAGDAPTTDEVLAAVRKAWADEPFVVTLDGPPSTKATLGSNVAHVTARADRRTGWLVALAAIDNLTKGSSGQAIQCANLMLGLPEGTGLPTVGLHP